MASLVAMVALAYSNALEAGFVYDDIGSVVENYHVQWESITLDGLQRAWLQSPTRRGVANWSFGLNHLGFGLDASAFHAVNVGIHALAVLGVFALVLRLCRRSDARLEGAAALAVAWVAAATFAVHPIQTQAVTYVVQRMASLSGLFCVVSLLCYARARTPGPGRAGRWLVASGLAWLAALSSKESAAAFPAVLWAYEWFFVEGSNRRVLLRMAIGVFMAGAGAFVLMIFNYNDPFRDYMYHDFSIGERLLSQGRVLFEYVGLVLWPHPSRLVLMHEFPASRGFFEPVTTAFSWLALLGVAAFGVASARRRPWVSFGLIWIAAALVVESSVFPLRLVHEHRLYLPMVGVVILLGAGLAPLARRSPLWVVLGALPFLLALGLGTHTRNKVWQNPESLWADVVAKSPTHAGAHQNLGSAYLESGRVDEALSEFIRGREADPKFGGNYRGIGVVHFQRGEYEKAIELYERAARLDPLDHFAFAQWGSTLHVAGRSAEAVAPLLEAIRIFEHPKSHNHLGRALAAKGRFEEAILHHRRALELDPSYGHARVALAHALAASGRTLEARRSFEAAIGSSAEADARTELASLAWSTGDAATAQAQLRQALALAPGASAAANNLAWMLAAVPEPSAAALDEAARWVKVATDTAGEADAGLLDTQALVVAASGRFGEASALADRAVALARAAGDVAMAEDIAARASLYRSEQRFVEPHLARGTSASDAVPR